MTLRGQVLCTAAAVSVAGWLPAASAGYLGMAGLWAHPFFASGVHWTWAWATYLPTGATNWWSASLLGVSGFLASFPALFTAALAMAGTGRDKQPLHGETGWLGDRDAKRGGFSYSRLPRPDSIVIGARGFGPLRRYVGLPGEEHAALTAKTRSGKGVSVVVPNALNWGGSLVSFSVKRDVFEAAAGHRRRTGDAVFVFDLSDPARRTHRWNPLGYVRRGRAETYGDIYRAMWFLVPETKSNNPFFDNAARKVGAAIAVILAETPGAKLNVAAVLGAVQRPDWPKYLGGLIEEARAQGRPYSLSAVNILLGMIARKDEKEARDVIVTLTTVLGLWDDPVVAAATEESDFDLAELRCERMAVFVCGGPADIRIYRPVYGLLFQQLVQMNTRAEFGRDPRHRHRVLGILDEFWALGKQDVLADASAFTASYGFRWAYVQQSEEQSVAAFGPEGAKNLFTNTGARLDFGGMDREAAEKISRWAGENTVKAKSRSRPAFFSWFAVDKGMKSESERPRPLVLPQDVQRLSAGKLLVRRGNLRLFKLDRVVSHHDPWFKRFAWSSNPDHKPLGPPPPGVPPLAVEVVREDLAAIAAARREAAQRAKAAARVRAEEADEKERARAAKAEATARGRAERIEEAERRRSERAEEARAKAQAKRMEAEAKRSEAEREAEAKRAEVVQEAERQAEAQRARSGHRLAQLQAAQRGAAAGEAEAAAEARGAVAKAAAATEAAKAARADAKGGGATATEEAARLAAQAAEATETARQAKLRASAAVRDAKAAAKRLEAFERAFEATHRSADAA